MCPSLEEGEECLAHDGGVVVVHLAEQQVTPDRFVVLLLQPMIQQEYLAKGGGGFGQGQGGLEGEGGVVNRQHGMDGMSQLVRQSGNVAGLALVVGQHPGGEVGCDAPAERTAALAVAHFAVQVVLVEDALGEAGQLPVEAGEGVEDHVRRLGKRVGLVGAGYRRVDVVTAQAVHAEDIGFQDEEAVENFGVFLADVQQGIHYFVGNVVRQVAGGEGRGEAAQVDLLVMPVAHQCLVHLTQDGTVLAVDTVQFLIGAGTQVAVGVVGVGHQPIAGQRFLLAVDFDGERVAIGEQLV